MSKRMRVTGDGLRSRTNECQATTIVHDQATEMGIAVRALGRVPQLGP